MNGREGVATFFLFVLLLIIILLQILSMVQSDRLYENLNRLNDTLEDVTHTESVKVGAEKGAPIAVEPSGNEGDWLIWAFRVEPRTLNPISAEANIYTTWITVPYIFEPLLVHDHDEVKLKPWLAESYEVSSDGLEITFQLRDNIHFSDGAPVTADDVVFTYETAVNPKVDAANIANKYIDVSEVTKISNRVVKFLMKRPCSQSLENLSFVWSIGILPEHIYRFSDPREFNRRVSNPVGSGPYVFDKWDVGRQMVLSRNESYWGSKPKLKRIIYRFIANPVACIQALRCHEVDIVIPEPEQFAVLVKDAQFNKDFYCLSYWTPWTPYYYIGWNHDSPFFCDKRVRLAMTHIVNRKQIVAHLLEGHGQVVTGPFYVHGPKNDGDIEPWPYDQEKAKQLLEASGWRDTNGDGVRDRDGTALRFKFMYSSSYALFDRLARLFKDEAATVGIDVICEPCEWSILLGRLNEGQFDAYIAGWGGDVLEDPYKLFHSSQIGNLGSNYVGFNNPQADAIMQEARRTASNGNTSELYHRLHRILHEEQPYTFLFTRPTFRLVDRRFENVTIHKLGLNYLEWYVPEQKQRYK